MTFLKYIFSFLILFAGNVALQAQTTTASEQQAAAIPASAGAVQPLQAGTKIPSVSFITPEMESFNLNDYVPGQPVVLIFYRGGWCPYCNIHLQELMEADPQLRALGYEILAVSPDAPEKLAESLKKHEMSYRLLSDRNMDAAKAFGVAYQVAESTAQKYQSNGIELTEGPAENQQLLPVPSVFIIDKEGTIRYVYYHADIKTRIKNEELLQEAKEVQRKKRP